MPTVVSCWEVSQKHEYAVHTFRPKLYRLLPEFLEEYLEPEEGLEFSEISSSFGQLETSPKIQRNEIEMLLSEDLPAENVDFFYEPEYFEPGEIAARKAMDNFLLKSLTPTSLFEMTLQKMEYPIFPLTSISGRSRPAGCS